MKNLIVAALFFLVGCAGKYDESQLVGEWTGVEWRDVTNDRVIDAAVAFTFDEDGRYEASSGTSTEKGKYWITEEKLYTIEDGKAEKKVEIAKLENDSLLLRMNRAGVIEEILLVREN